MIRTRTFLRVNRALLLCASSVSACSPAPAPAPAASSASAPAPISDDCTGESAVDVVHHAIELSLRLDPPLLSGRGDVQVRARRETKVIALDAQGLRISEIATATGPLRFRHTGDRLCAELPRPLPAGAAIAVHLVREVPADHETLHVAADQIWAGYTSSAWMPTRQDPGQRATLSLRITAPAAWKVAAVGHASAPDL